MGTTAAVQSIYYHSAAALAFSLWDFLTTLGDEVHYIWPMKRRHTFRWLYMFHRHFLLVTHIACQILLPFFPVMSSHICRALLASMALVAECANFTVEFILAFRVCVLFGRRPWISRLLGCLMLAELLCCMVNATLTLKSYGGGMLFQLSPNAKTQMASTAVVHSTLVTLTVVKYLSIVRGRGAGRNVISQFILDGAVTYLVMAGLLGFGFTITTVSSSEPIILFFWALTVHSVCGSRLILNMARIQDRLQGLREDESILLTTQLGHKRPQSPCFFHVPEFRIL
ncbi:hypothetical protein M404DRAFT_242975 [Pisolithus tinctorius Marx 270]|uniref:DUF6533 domain-containing protein n=1 Tax=Pisolithus tinctorius Marx 270 TaxID=870435 RepID=A0A0C3NMT3_PISTI|nr:hypothetical protein M404DRAFT_242975 [Pisolithus tinctorius Marx 270]